jgi:hypothetical protein
MVGALLSPYRLLRHHRAQALKKLRLVDRLLQDGGGFTGSKCSVTGDNDDPNTSIVQLIDQDIGALAAAEAEVNERNIGGLLADQTLGRGGRRNRAGHVCPASLEQALHGTADVPAIFNHKDTHSVQIRGSGLQRAMSAG